MDPSAKQSSGVRTRKRKKNHPCPDCGKMFTFKSSVRRHANVVHKKVAPTGHCEICNEDYFTNYHQHLEEKHGHKVEVESHVFQTEKEFYEWKDRIEKETISSFTTKYTLPDGKVYGCHRVADPKTWTEERRKRCRLYKCTLACPAKITLRRDPSGVLKITWVKTHLGHTNDLQHLILPHLDRQRIIQMCELGLSPSQIVKSLTNVPEKTERIHLITVEEVSTIKKCHERLKRVTELRALLPPTEKPRKRKKKRNLLKLSKREVMKPPELQMNSITLDSKQLSDKSNVVFLVPQVIHFGPLDKPVTIKQSEDFTEDLPEATPAKVCRKSISPSENPMTTTLIIQPPSTEEGSSEKALPALVLQPPTEQAPLEKPLVTLIVQPPPSSELTSSEKPLPTLILQPPSSEQSSSEKPLSTLILQPPSTEQTPSDKPLPTLILQPPSSEQTASDKALPTLILQPPSTEQTASDKPLPTLILQPPSTEQTASDKPLPTLILQPPSEQASSAKPLTTIILQAEPKTTEQMEKKRYSSLEKLRKLRNTYKDYLAQIGKAITLLNSVQSEAEMDNIVRAAHIYFPDLTHWHTQKASENLYKPI